MAQEQETGGFSPPVIYADRVDGFGFEAGQIRLVFGAKLVTSQGEAHVVLSGGLVLTVDAALELRTQLDQLLTQLEKQGLIQLPRGPLQS